MSRSSLELYVYSTKTYLERGMLKVGHCQTGRSKQRIEEQFGTSNPEQPIVLLVKPLPDGKTDRDIHNQLLAMGIDKVEDSPGREWFEASKTDVLRAYNDVVFGVQRIDSYPLRKEQKEAVEKAVRWFNKQVPSDLIGGASHKDRFLLNAKMRFGKCFTGLHIAKAIKSKRILVVTYKPEVIVEWMSAALNHVDFAEWKALRARKPNNNCADDHLDESGIIPNSASSLLICASLQDLKINSDGSTKSRLKQVINTKWDLIIFDEVHFGSKTERAKYIIDSLHWGKRLDLSGTPFRLIQEDDFCADQVFTYSYLDEQKNKQEEKSLYPNGDGPKIYRVMPDLEVLTVEITDKDIQEQRENFFSDDMDISLNELFKASGGIFKHEDAVSHFLDGLCKRTHDAKAISVFGKLGDQLSAPVKRHTVWWLNRVDAVKALAKKLRQHPYFSQFEIINAAGCEKSNSDEECDAAIVEDKSAIEKKINTASQEPNKLGTITLTVKRFLTGVTIKEWDSILILNDVASAESYYQAIFRVQSAWQDQMTKEVIKPKAWVFDFAITRCLRLTYHYADALADQLDQQDSANRLRKDNLQPIADGLCESLNIKRFFEGNLTPNTTSSKDIFDAINLNGSRVSLAKRITSDALVNFISLKELEAHPNLLDALKRVKGYRTQEVGSVEDFVKIGHDAKNKLENKRRADEDELGLDNEEFVENEQDKDQRSQKRWFATQIKRLAICIADFVYMTQFREYNISHVIETKDPEFFFKVTGINKEEFHGLCNLGFINTLALNRIVREFRCQEESSLKPEEYILNHLNKIA